ncbi:MAG: hypothetical protein NCW75_06520 [Phycisphaera sp.]|nr:MAG: hypothetical protein NCW75_06520 [Phycisphaera sp.]
MNCPKCKYDLRSIDHTRCPECGSDTYAVFAEQAERRHRRGKIARMACFWGLLIVLLGGLGYVVYVQVEEYERARKQEELLKARHPR